MDDHRLSQIETAWSIVRRAHGDESMAARSAQEQLLDLYGSAIKRYLLAALKDQAAADDTYQNFAVRFLRGDFHNASEERGRFRSFLKTSLFRLVADHYRGRKKQAEVTLESKALADDSDEVQQRERDFMQVWRDEMLKRSWDALAAAEEKSGKPWFTVMRMRVDNPKLRSPELSESLSNELGRKVTPANVRVLLHRAREKFSHVLIDCIADSLNTGSVQEIEEELAELELLEYCQPVLDKRKEQEE